MTGQGPLPNSVLVVDDEPVVLTVLTRALKPGGWAVTCVDSAEAAFEILAKEEFGAVLTDKNLPSKSGLEVIKEARRLYPYCACLLMTGYANTESVIEAMRLGANDYLEKPFSELGLVVQRLKSAFEHQRVVFERAALAEGLRHMERTLRSRDQEMFAQRTEVELMQHVVELKVEDALAELNQRRARLEAERSELLDRVAKLLQRDVQLCLALNKAAKLCATTAKKEDLSLEKARQTFLELEKKLYTQTDTLRA